jgi:hypothetical protein
MSQRSHLFRSVDDCHEGEGKCLTRRSIVISKIGATHQGCWNCSVEGQKGGLRLAIQATDRSLPPANLQHS